MENRYYLKYAVAAARGNLVRTGKSSLLSEDLLNTPLELLTEDACRSILSAAKGEGVKLYYFKKSDRTLPRVNKVIGFLKSVYFENILDVGSGRGVFLLPFLEEFPSAKVHSVDILEKRYNLLSDIRAGGVSRLSVSKEDICGTEIPDNSFDIVTVLEVLEHIPNYTEAIRQAVRIARKFVIITVPSKEDGNPEHIHLLTKEKLTAALTLPKVKKMTFDGVPCHLFAAAKLEDN